MTPEQSQELTAMTEKMEEHFAPRQITIDCTTAITIVSAMMDNISALEMSVIIAGDNKALLTSLFQGAVNDGLFNASLRDVLIDICIARHRATHSISADQSVSSAA